MQNGTYRVLFMSRRNSARSVMAEAILNKIGRGRFEAISAAVDPAPVIEPSVLELLRSSDYPIEELTPRHFGVLAQAGAADLDFVFTLSDTAAGEPLPEWPGLPITSHWRCPDPVLVQGEAWERKQAFMQVLTGLERRLNIFINLPFTSLDRMSLQSQVREIGEAQDA
jgi:arsenate reductase (thioredoxin)